VSRMSDYCKAYYVRQFREYPHWSEREVAGLHAELLEEANGAAAANSGSNADRAATALRPLSDDDVLFLHDNYHVTDSVFADEHVVFDAVTSEWRTFCESVLGFEIPDYARAVPAEQPASHGDHPEADAAAASTATTTIAAGA
jgi:hypothetical protein